MAPVSIVRLNPNTPPTPLSVRPRNSSIAGDELHRQHDDERDGSAHRAEHPERLDRQLDGAEGERQFERAGVLVADGVVAQEPAAAHEAGIDADAEPGRHRDLGVGEVGDGEVGTARRRWPDGEAGAEAFDGDGERAEANGERAGAVESDAVDPDVDRRDEVRHGQPGEAEHVGGTGFEPDAAIEVDATVVDRDDEPTADADAVTGQQQGDERAGDVGRHVDLEPAEAGGGAPAVGVDVRFEHRFGELDVEAVGGADAHACGGTGADHERGRVRHDRLDRPESGERDRERLVERREPDAEVTGELGAVGGERADGQDEAREPVGRGRHEVGRDVDGVAEGVGGERKVDPGGDARAVRNCSGDGGGEREACAEGRDRPAGRARAGDQPGELDAELPAILDEPSEGELERVLEGGGELVDRRSLGPEQPERRADRPGDGGGSSQSEVHELTEDRADEVDGWLAVGGDDRGGVGDEPADAVPHVDDVEQEPGGVG